jgi:AcrR family transcriptional regulator
MARVIKAPEVRRAEILQVAWGLFAERGYEGTKVAMVLERAGIAKGTFYHYFASKEALLDAVVEAMTERGLVEVQAAMAAAGAGGLQQLNAFLTASRGLRTDNMALIVDIALVLHRDENAIMLRKLRRRVDGRVRPILAAIVATGAGEGAFDAGPPYDEMAQVILDLGHAVADQNLDTLIERLPPRETANTILRRLNAVGTAVERLLETKGPLSVIDDGFVAALERYLDERGKKSQGGNDDSNTSA